MTTNNQELIDEITNLKQEKHAVIIAHNYQREEVQDIADFTGDSLELARIASTIDCEVIVFCGVDFMAESASILSPQKTVLLPEVNATCPMAGMVRAEGPRDFWKKFPGYDDQPTLIYPKEYSIKDIKAAHPGVPVVAYVNTTAEVKAAVDICCTSANVIDVINSLPDKEVICIPDKNLSMWAQKNTDKKIIAWDGFCHVHDRVTAKYVNEVKAKHPDALFMAHPECRPEVCDLADHVTSTSGMLRFATASEGTEFIVGTETGLMYRLRKENPQKTFHALREDMICPNMKKTNLTSVRDALKETKHVVKVPEDVRVKAKLSLDRMLEITAKSTK
jgi:quinolinate synthase